MNMSKNTYKVVDDFQVKDARVLVLNKDYEYDGGSHLKLRGKVYNFIPNSVRRWLIIKSNESFIGENIEFV